MRPASALYAYQRRAAKFVEANRRCALHVDVGLGKSISTLTAIVQLLKRFQISQVLVVGPKRVASFVWADEIKIWAHTAHLAVVCVKGTPAQRAALLETNADIHCIGRDNVVWLKDYYANQIEKKGKWHSWPKRCFPFDMIVLDESQSFKSAASKRFKAMKTLIGVFPMVRVVELTASPIPNGYKDLWSQYYLLDGGARLGKVSNAFMDRFFEKQGAYEYGRKLRDKAQFEIEKQIADITLTLKQEDYLDLPPIVKNFVWVKLSPEELKLYRRMERIARIELKGRVINAVNAGVLCGKLCQLANGAVYYDDKQNFETFHNHKIDALEELLEGIPGRVIVAYNYKSDLARIKAMLPGTGRSFRLMKTDQDKSDWNAKKIDILLLHPASAGHGLNLQHSGAEDFIWFGFNENLEYYEQAPARLFGGHRRLGGARIHHIVAQATRDEDLVAIVSGKDLTQYSMTRRMAEIVKEI